MKNDQRRAKRQSLTCSSRLVTADGSMEDCRFTDISASGARLEVKDPAHVPDRFLVVLSERWKIFRRCTVIWRGEKQIGVKFRATV